MFKGLGIAVLAAGLMVTGAAWAGEFYPVKIEADSVIVVDLDSIRTLGPAATVIAVWVDAEEKTLNGSPVGHVEVTEELRCATRERRRVGMRIFGPDGKQIGRSESQGEWKAGAPGSLADDMVKIVCEPATRNLEKLMSLPTPEMVARARKLMAGTQ